MSVYEPSLWMLSFLPNLPREPMKQVATHRNEDVKPFYIGQLVQSNYEDPGDYFSGLSLILDLEWSLALREWRVHAFNQKTGNTGWHWSCHYAGIEKNT
jgi:hypothetical protein